MTMTTIQSYRERREARERELHGTSSREDSIADDEDTW